MNRIGRDELYGLARTGNITLRVGQLRLVRMGRDRCQRYGQCTGHALMNEAGWDGTYVLARTGNTALRVGQLRLMRMGRDR
jgi:hypothetical protein